MPASTATDYSALSWSDLKEQAKDRGVVLRRRKRTDVEHDLSVMDSGGDPEEENAGVTTTSLRPPENPGDHSLWFRYPSPGIVTRYRAEQYTMDRIHIKDSQHRPPSIVAIIDRQGPKLEKGTGRVILPFRRTSKLIVDCLNANAE